MAFTNIINLLTQPSSVTPTPPATTWCHTFNNNLVSGASGDEVADLHAALKEDGVYPSWAAFGTSNFDQDTISRVKAFQKKYGIAQVGYVGPNTRRKLNALYGCKIITPDCASLYWTDNTDKSCSSTKTFCGAYMYQGLQTFQTQQACLGASNQNGLSSITVTSPNGGETFPQGSSIPVTWTQNFSDGGTIVIDLINSSGYEFSTTGAPIVGIIGTNSATLPVTSYQGTGQVAPPGQYKVKVCDVSGENPCVTSANYFTITSAQPVCTGVGRSTCPSGQVCNSGVCVGQSVTMTVNGSSGPTVNVQSGSTINLAWSTTITNGTCALNTFVSGQQTQPYKQLNASGTIQVQPTVNTSYVMGCSNGQDGVGAYSDSIAVQVSSSTQSSITVTSPNGGETLTQGASIPVTWTQNFNHGGSIFVGLINASGHSFTQTSSVAGIIGMNSATLSPVSIYTGQVAPPGQYKVEVFDVSTTGISDYSDNYFTIVAP